MANAIDLTKPETFKLSDEAYDQYRENRECLHNSVARKNPDESLFDAMLRNEESFAALRIDGKSVSDFIKDL